MPCERRVQNIDDFIDPQVGSTHTFNFSQRETINQPGERICLEGVRDSRFCPILVEVGEILNVSGDTVELTAEVLDKAEISINEVEGHRLIPAESGMTKCIDCEQRFVLQENGTLVGSGTFDRTFLRHGPSEGGINPMALGCVAEQFLERHIPPKEPLVKGLLHKRDLVTFAGRRRHGKTTFLTNLAAALALNSDPFLGYEIPEARRSLMLLLEDDPAELQEKLARILGQSGTDGRLRVVTRDDCHENHVPIDISRPEFRQAVEEVAAEHEPDVIVIDNLAHVVNARYNDAELIHQLVFQLYEWARAYDAAVILAAHPRKEDVSHPVRLETDPEMFFETVMGSSHLVNSTGNLWGLQRHYDEDYAVFLGGRQRGEGQQAYTVIEKREDDWFKVLPRTVVTMDLLVNTQKRKEAWNLLPAHPQTFRYRQGQELVSSVMSSSASYANWMRDLRRHSLILDSGNELQKNPEAPTRVGV